MTDGKAPSPVKASLHVERADRVPIGRPATLRERQTTVCDVTVEDLSATGCRVKGGIPLPLGSLISIGIPGTGMHAARVARIGAGEFACAFLVPMSEEDIARARSAETVAPGHFPTVTAHLPRTDGVPHRRRATDRVEPRFLDRLRLALRVLLGRV